MRRSRPPSTRIQARCGRADMLHGFRSPVHSFCALSGTLARGGEDIFLGPCVNGSGPNALTCCAASPARYSGVPTSGLDAATRRQNEASGSSPAWKPQQYAAYRTCGGIDRTCVHRKGGEFTALTCTLTSLSAERTLAAHSGAPCVPTCYPVARFCCCSASPRRRGDYQIDFVSPGIPRRVSVFR